MFRQNRAIGEPFNLFQPLDTSLDDGDGNEQGIGRGQSLVVTQNIKKYQELVLTSAESATLTQTCTWGAPR